MLPRSPWELLLHLLLLPHPLLLAVSYMLLLLQVQPPLLRLLGHCPYLLLLSLGWHLLLIGPLGCCCCCHHYCCWRCSAHAKQHCYCCQPPPLLL
jgi:hypothetical protein